MTFLYLQIQLSRIRFLCLLLSRTFRACPALQEALELICTSGSGQTRESAEPRQGD